MILESNLIKKVFDLIKYNTLVSILEIITNQNFIKFGANYNDKYYIEYKINTTDRLELRSVGQNDRLEVDEHVILSTDTFNKLEQLVNLWPRSRIQLISEGDHHTIEIIDYGNLLREKPVSVDCVFEKGDVDYLLNAPEMKPNCEVCAKNLKQMLEFCSVQKSDVLLSLSSGSLIVNNSTKTLGTKVEVDEMYMIARKPMKLSAEANGLLVEFLGRLLIKASSVFMLFMEREYAFSVYTTLSPNETIQIFTIHD
jgi:hypothetical protein